MSALRAIRQSGGTYTGTDLSRVVEDNDLGVERSGLGSGLVLGVGANCRLADVHALQMI